MHAYRGSRVHLTSGSLDWQCTLHHILRTAFIFFLPSKTKFLSQAGRHCSVVRQCVRCQTYVVIDFRKSVGTSVTAYTSTAVNHGRREDQMQCLGIKSQLWISGPANNGTTIASDD